MLIESVMLSNHLILCCLLILLLSIFPSIRVFSGELTLHITWPKYWSFNFSISLSSEYSGLISFRIDWFGLLAVQATLECLLQHHSSKAPILQCSAFFMVQFSHPYMNTGKTIASTIWASDGKVVSLLFNTLFSFVIVLLPSCQQISHWVLQRWELRVGESGPGRVRVCCGWDTSSSLLFDTSLEKWGLVCDCWRCYSLSTRADVARWYQERL